MGGLTGISICGADVRNFSFYSADFCGADLENSKAERLELTDGKLNLVDFEIRRFIRLPDQRYVRIIKTTKFDPGQTAVLSLLNLSFPKQALFCNLLCS